MPLPFGNYHIRWAPRDPPAPKGLYATSEGIGAQIATKSWTIAPVVGKPRFYTITPAQFNGHGAGWGFGLVIPVNVPVILTQDRVAEWFISIITEFDRIYRIIDPNTIVGFNRAVAEDNNRLFVNSYKVGANLPQWQIVPSGIEN